LIMLPFANEEGRRFMTYFQEVGKDPVVAKNGMVATSHIKASEVGLEILKSGGNAADAAIAACAVQCVVEPGSTGIGGDCFWMYAPKGGSDMLAYNGSGRSPSAASWQWYRQRGYRKIDPRTPHSVTIPGAIDAWDCFNKHHGRMELSELLGPAIELARDGYKITKRVAYDFNMFGEALKLYENSSKVFAPNGVLPSEGDVHHQPLLAGSLEHIALDGRDAFYEGEIAEDIVKYLASLGGLHTLQDFSRARGNYVRPIKANYLDHDIYQCPPNGQGIIALMLLRVMEQLGRPNDDPLDPRRMHLEIEAGRICYSLRDAYLADPDFSDIPVHELLSDENIDKIVSLISEKGAIEDPGYYEMPDHKDTVYITVVDKDRNCCSFINSLFQFFGSGLMAPKSGILLHSRGSGFSLERDHPNAIDGNKRPLHTLIPGMVVKDGKTVMSYGVMGGAYQAFGHMQFLGRFLDYGLNLQEAMNLPRFFPDINENNVSLEEILLSIKGIKLEALGHKPVKAPYPIGGSQAIWIDQKNGTLIGGTDPRKDGCALGY
jgi:gamma-glutamyltranspeptidase/glutathione hydrolase